MSYIIVFIGGGVGAALRHGVNRAAAYLLGDGFPFGTLFVNVVGSFAMGVLAGLFLIKGMESHPVRLFLTTGVLGGFTTFSAFSLDATLMWQKGEWLTLALYAVGSVIAAVAALFVGMAAARGFG